MSEPGFERSGDTWAVVKTQPHKEKLAIEHLDRQSFTTYCPMIRKSILRRRRRIEVARPLFPNYLMIQIDPAFDRWRPVLSTLGVSTMVRFGDEVALLDGRFVDSLRAREENGIITLPDQPFEVGQVVRVAGGPFDGTVARILSLEGCDRLVVLMDILQRSVRVKLDQRQAMPL